MKAPSIFIVFIIITVFANVSSPREKEYKLNSYEHKLIDEYLVKDKSCNENSELCVYLLTKLEDKNDFKEKRKVFYIMKTYLNKNDIYAMKDDLKKFFVASIFYSLDHLKEWPAFDCRFDIFEILIKANDSELLNYIKSFIFPLQEWQLNDNDKIKIKNKIDVNTNVVINKTRQYASSSLIFSKYDKHKIVLSEIKQIVSCMKDDPLYKVFMQQIEIFENETQIPD